jgi:hypothetical protein
MARFDLKEILDICVTKHGCRIEYYGSHVRVLPPDPKMGMVGISQHPSDHRAIRNFIAQLRRAGIDVKV